MGKMIMSQVVDAGSSQQQSHPVAPRAQPFLFTLIFAHGEVALLTVSGARSSHHARSIAEYAIDHCRYTVVDGDHTGGNVHCFYYWCAVQAQERTPRLDDSLSEGGLPCH